MLPCITTLCTLVLLPQLFKQSCALSQTAYCNIAQQDLHPCKQCVHAHADSNLCCGHWCIVSGGLPCTVRNPIWRHLGVHKSSTTLPRRLPPCSAWRCGRRHCCSLCDTVHEDSSRLCEIGQLGWTTCKPLVALFISKRLFQFRKVISTLEPKLRNAWGQ